MIASFTARRWPAYVLILLIALVIAMLLGKDMNWDQLNYHTYAGFNVMEGRLLQDYFAAGPHTYLNPYSHVPFYLMVMAAWAPQIIVGVLALFHALNLLIAYELGLLLNRRANGQVAWLAVGLGVFFVLANPVFLTELGSTFNEISTSVLVLAGWYLLVRDFNTGRAATIALAGALIGAAVALKLTNLYFSVTALPLLLLAPIGLRLRARNVLVFALGGMLGALVAGGWWSLQLWEQFGNPFLPMFNHIFHAPEFTDAPLKHYRFMPDSLAAVLLKPITMTTPWAAVHIEIMAPDLRYVFLLLLAGALALTFLLRRFGSGKFAKAVAWPQFEQQRAFAALAASFVLAWFFWLLTSGNSRYFLAMGCVAGVLLASLLVRISDNRRFITYMATFLVIFQSGLVLSSGIGHWTPAGFGKAWYELEVPPVLQKEASLYLNIDVQTPSFLMPFLPRESSLMTISGIHILEPNAKTQALIDKYRGNIRVVRRVYVDAVPPPEQLNFPLIRFGLEADLSSCAMVKSLMRELRTTETVYWYYIFCKTKPLSWSADKLADYSAGKQRVSDVFDKLEVLCPNLFSPRGLATEGDGVEFWRHYTDTDMALALKLDGNIAYRNLFLRSKARDIGSLERLSREMPDKARLCP
ncbi:MAG: hypothetical protein V4723_20790 [Pseudomonadota bacterium]